MATGAGHDLRFAALYRRTQQPLHNVMHKICQKLISEEDNFVAVPPTDNFQVRVMFKSVHDLLKAEREARGDPEVDKYDLSEKGNKIRFNGSVLLTKLTLSIGIRKMTTTS